MKGQTPLLLLCVLVLGLNVAAALSYGDVKDYTLSGKTCKDEATLLVDRDVLQKLLDNYQTKEKLQSEIDILKEVRRLIVFAKGSIKSIDEGFLKTSSFIQTVDRSQVKGVNIDEIFTMVETFESATESVDKLKLCDRIVAAIDELIGLQESFINQDGYANLPVLLKEKIQQIDNYLNECKNSTVGSVKLESSNGAGSVKVGTETPTETTDSTGSAKVVSDGFGSVKIGDDVPTTSESNNSGSAKITSDGSGSASVGDIIEVNNDKSSGSAKVSSEGSGSAKVGEEAQVNTDKSSASAKVGSEGSGSAKVGEEAQANTDKSSASAKVNSDGAGSAKIDSQSGSSSSEKSAGSVQVASDGAGSAKIEGGLAASTTSFSASAIISNQGNGSAKMSNNEAKALIQTDSASFVSNKLKSKKSKSHRHNKQASLGF